MIFSKAGVSEFAADFPDYDKIARKPLPTQSVAVVHDIDVILNDFTFDKLCT